MDNFVEFLRMDWKKKW